VWSELNLLFLQKRPMEPAVLSPQSCATDAGVRVQALATIRVAEEHVILRNLKLNVHSHVLAAATASAFRTKRSEAALANP
jgi:hypothetical protein